MAGHKALRRTVGRGLLAVGLGVGLLPFLPAASGADDNVANPDLAGACGIDLSIIIDRSGSIGTDNDEVRNAAQAMIDAVEGTGSEVKITRFSSEAEGLGASGNGGSAGDYTDVIDDIVFRDPAGVTLPAGGFSSSGSTNWDDALEVTRRSEGGGGPLVIMITDGDPTQRNAGVTVNDGVATNGHNTGLGGDGSTVSETNVDEAEDEADDLQANSHMFVIGVGAALNNATSEGRIQRISGAQRLEGPNGTLGNADDVPFGQADYTLVQDFGALAGRMRALIIELCAPSLNVRKMLIPVGGNVNNAVPQSNWPFATFVEDYVPTWQTPGSSVPGQPNRGTLNTDASGFANFKWEPPAATPTLRTDVELSESLPAGVAFDSVVCTRNSFNGGQSESLTEVVTANEATRTIRLAGTANNMGPEQAINCTVYNRTIAPSTIRVDKDTVPDLAQSFAFNLFGQANGQGPSIGSTTAADATPPTSAVLSNSLQPGTYSVVETPVANFTQSANPQCTRISPAPTVTAPASNIPVGEGQVWECDFTNTAANGSITVVKNTVGAPVGTFTFTETAPGTFPGGSEGAFSLTTAGNTASKTLTGVTPTVGATTYSITENNPSPWTGNATGSCVSQPSGATFASNAIVVAPGANVTCTFTNTAPAPTITVTKGAIPTTVAETGGSVTYTVNVTNNSPVEALTITALTDTVEGVGATLPSLATMCPAPVGQTGLTIPPGQTRTCTFTLTVSEANDANNNNAVPDTVNVTAQDPEGTVVTGSASASVSLSNVVPVISISKTANPTSVNEPGGNVTYTVTVTNQSTQDAVTINSLQDVIEGSPTLNLLTNTAITSTCDDQFDTAIPASSSRSCTFTIAVNGNPATMTPDDVITDTVTASGVDDDGETVPPVNASAGVTVLNVAPTITVDKQAPVSVVEPATTATYTVVITNTSAEPVTVTSIVDAFPGFGPVDFLSPSQAANTDCDTADLNLAASPGPGHTVTCTFTVPLGSNDGDSTITNTVQVTADDDEAADATNPTAPSATATDTATITIVDVEPDITVGKDAGSPSVDEPGGDVVFTVSVLNTGVEPLQITAINDSVPGVGNIDVLGLGNATSCDEVVALINAEPDGGLNPQASFQCTFTLNVAGNPADLNPDSVTDTVTVTVTDNDGNNHGESDTATVAINDLLPSVSVVKDADPTSQPEPGGPAGVTYTVTITNDRAERARISSITDSPTPLPASGTCDELVTNNTFLEGGASTTCSFVLPFTGNAGDSFTDTVTVELTDDEGNTDTDTDTATTALTNVAPTIEVTKEANGESNDDDVIAEPGGQISYTITIRNTSTVDPVTIMSISDVFDGAPAVGRCAGLVGGIIQPGGFLSCTYNVTVTGQDAGDTIANTVTVGVNDDDEPGTPTGEVTDTATEVVTVTDAAPSMTVVKDVVDGNGAVIANPTVTEPGGPVNYRVTVTNTSTDTLTIASIQDAVFDDVGTEPEIVATTCNLVGQVLASQASTSCTFTLNVAGNPGGGVNDVRDRFTVTAEDDDPDDPDNGPDVTGFDDAVVNINDAPPSATVSKTSNVPTVPEPGGLVTFTVSVTNGSSTEALTISTLTDDVGGIGIVDITTVPVVAPVTATTCNTLVGASLAPSQTKTCTFTMPVNGNAGADIDDRVTVTLDDDEVGNPITPFDDHEIVVTDVPPTVVVTKTNGDGTVAAPGENVDFVVNVQNTSPEAVTITSITDTIGDGDPFDVTTPATPPVLETDCETGIVLAATNTTNDDDTYQCTFTLFVGSTEADLETDRVDVTVEDDDGNEPEFPAQATTTVTAVADLSVDKGLTGTLGRDGVYTLTVANGGPSTAVGVVVTDTLPAGMTATSATGAGWTCAITNSGRTVTCNRPQLGAGASSVISVPVVVAASLAGTSATNTVVVESPTDDPDVSNNTDTRTDPVPSVTVVANPAPPTQVGGVQVAPPLPRTGAETGRWILISGVLILLGGLLLLGSSNRRDHLTLRSREY